MTVRTAQKGHADRVLRYVVGGRQLENGLLQFNTVPDLPADVAIGSALGGYFSGSGTIFYCGPIEPKHAQGKYSAAGCPTFSEPPPGSAEWPLTDGNYVSRLYAAEKSATKNVLDRMRENRTLASRYSGLMQLAVQAWIGSGRSPEDVCPFGTMRLDDGLICDDQMNFWWVRIDIDEITFRPMLVPSNLAQLKTSIAAVLPAAAGYVENLVVLLAGLEAGSADDEIIVDPGMSGVYQAGYFSLTHGWQYSRHTKKAVIALVVHTSTSSEDHYNGQVHELTFAFDENSLPDATLAKLQSAVSFRINAAFHPLWVPSGEHEYRIVHNPTVGGYTDMELSTPFFGNVSAIQRWYDDNDELDGLDYHQLEVTVVTGVAINEGDLFPCGDTGAYRTGTISSGATIEGGFARMGETPPDDVSGTFSDSRFNWTKTRTGAVVTLSKHLGSKAYDWRHLMGVKVACDCGNDQYHPAYTPFYAWLDDPVFSEEPYASLGWRPVEISVAPASGEGTRQDMSANNYRATIPVIIAINDSGAYFQARLYSASSGSRTRRTYTNPGVLARTAGTGQAMYHSADIRNTDDNGDYLYEDVPLSSVFSSNIAGGASGAGQGMQCALTTDDDAYDSIETESLTSGVESADLITRAGDFDVDEEDGGWVSFVWDGLLDPGVRVASLNASTSFAGDCSYTRRADYESTVETGYSDVEDLPFVRRWMGFS